MKNYGACNNPSWGGSGQDTKKPTMLAALFIRAERADTKHHWAPVWGALLGEVRVGSELKSGRPLYASASETGFS